MSRGARLHSSPRRAERPADEIRRLLHGRIAHGLPGVAAPV